jgi:hypothetical protein
MKNLKKHRQRYTKFYKTMFKSVLTCGCGIQAMTNRIKPNVKNKRNLLFTFNNWSVHTRLRGKKRYRKIYMFSI